jgi:transposase-like protein
MQESLADTPNEIPATLSEIVRLYNDPDVATRALAAARWGDTPECLHCLSRERHSYISTRRIWKCRTCRKQFSPRVGTIFEDSPIGLDRWLIAIWVVATAEERATSYKLHQLLGVTQTTAQFMLRRIRLAVQVREAARDRSAAVSAAHAR